MALSLTSKWNLVACAVMAHADGVLDGEECDRLMSMVEDEVDGEEYAHWLAAISDPPGLTAMLESLEPPPAEAHREILEQAWGIAIVDGERCEAELGALTTIATRLGVRDMQLDFWREAWTTAQREFADSIGAALAVVLGGDGPVYAADRKLVREIVWGLPATDDQREQLVGVSSVPQPRDEVVRQLSGLNRRRRRWLLRLIAPAALQSVHADAARERFVVLADDAGVPAPEADAILVAAEAKA